MKHPLSHFKPITQTPAGIRRFTSFIGFISLVIGTFVTGCKKENGREPVAAPKIAGEKVTFPAQAPQLTSIAVDAAVPRQVSVAHLTGRLVWDENLTVRIFSPVAGRVKETLATLGQTVAAGEVLARIDSPDYGQAQADVRKASADLLLAERTLNRLRDLLEHGAAARKDMENAEDAHASAQSEKERATARLTLYGGAVGAIDQMYPLRTPLGGVIVDKNLNPGQEIRPDQMLANAPQLFAPLFIVSDPTRLWVLLDVTELDMDSLKEGQEIQIRTKAYPEKIFPGRLDLIGDSLDPAKRTVMVRGVVNNPGKLLKAEMYVMVDVTRATTAGVIVPAKAVFPRENQYYVFLEQAPGQYERRAVKLGPESDGKLAILNGLEAGQRVVTEGCLLLQAILESGG